MTPGVYGHSTMKAGLLLSSRELLPVTQDRYSSQEVQHRRRSKHLECQSLFFEVKNITEALTLGPCHGKICVCGSTVLILPINTRVSPGSRGAGALQPPSLQKGAEDSLLLLTTQRTAMSSPYIPSQPWDSASSS
jgi:hypothetical protein